MLNLTRQAGSRRTWAACALALACATVSFAQQRFVPARLLGGDTPPLSSLAVDGGEVVVEASVDRAGSVSRLTLLRTTPPFGDLVTAAVRSWRFSPAEGPRPDGTTGPVESTVLVAAVFRPPSLVNGPRVGEGPREVAAPSGQAPFPTTISTPAFPPLAVAGGVVMVEVEVEPDGLPGKAQVIRAGPGGFDSAAIDAVRQWRFRTPGSGARAVPSVAYVIFGFSQPVLAPSEKRQNR